MLFDKNDAQLILVSCQETVCAKSIDPGEFSAQVQKLARVAQIFQIPIWSVVHMPHVWGDYMKACQAFCERPMESALFSAADMLSPHLNPVRNPSAGNARSLPKHLQKPTDHSEPQRPLIVLAGCEVHVGVVQTALDLMDLDAAFDRLASVGVELTTVDMLCMEWLRSSKATESTAVIQALGKF